MSNLEDFLDGTVPAVLRDAQEEYPFVVVGTRAINAYLSSASLQSISTQDWDVAYVGDAEGQVALAQDVMRQVQDEGFHVDLEHHPASQESDNSVYAFKAREWLRLTVNVGDAKVAFLDVYRIPTMAGAGVFMVKHGLLYSDLGFLMRELNRAEEDAAKVIANSTNLSNWQIQEKLESSKRLLGDSGTDLDVVDAESDQLIETIGQVPTSKAISISADQMSQLERAKRTLVRVAEERDALFGAVASGRVLKLLAEQVCGVCRSMEDQYGRYKT